MIEFFQTAAPLMGFVSLMLIIACFIPFLGRSRAFQFICGESAFITTIAYGCLAALEVGWQAFFLAGFWFVIGSANFAISVWLTDH